MKKEKIYEATKEALKRRGVDLNELSKIVYDLQSPYQNDLTLTDCYDQIQMILKKTEVQHAVLTGIEIDEATERKLFATPLQEIIEVDEALYGVDEILALSIVNIYGTIALTNFGYLDKVKPGIIADFNNKKDGAVHTFLDDILCAIAASACSRLAHGQ